MSEWVAVVGFGVGLVGVTLALAGRAYYEEGTRMFDLAHDANTSTLQLLQLVGTYIHRVEDDR
jgi:hypothetical protein